MTEKSKYCEVCKGVTNEGLICLTHHKEEISRLRAEKKQMIELMEEVEDKLDEINDGSLTKDICAFCLAQNYTGGEGLVHKEDCIILRMRKELKEARKA